ncbi:MAG: VOC family protein [Dermatophilaceae bacterium]
MALRWYSVVVDARDVPAQARWWCEALGWQIGYEAPDEVVIVPGWWSEQEHAATPWERQAIGWVFVPVGEGKTVKNRLHLDLAPHTGDDQTAEVERLVSLGATRVNVGQDQSTVSWVVLADPEGNEFCVLSARED